MPRSIAPLRAYLPDRAVTVQQRGASVRRASQTKCHCVGIVADETMAVQTSFFERPAVHNEGLIVVYKITLINPNAFPPVIYGLHTPIYHIAVNIIFGNSV